MLERWYSLCWLHWSHFIFFFITTLLNLFAFVDYYSLKLPPVLSMSNNLWTIRLPLHLICTGGTLKVIRVVWTTKYHGLGVHRLCRGMGLYQSPMETHLVTVLHLSKTCLAPFSHQLVVIASCWRETPQASELKILICCLTGCVWVMMCIGRER